MGIEITSNGLTKRYRYYPQDAFYVNGKQVKEAWANGVKYYPESVNENAFVVRFFTDDFMARDIPRRYFQFGEPDWIYYDALLWPGANSRNEYLFDAVRKVNGDSVTRITINRNIYYDQLQFYFLLGYVDYESYELKWERGDRTSTDSTYNPSSYLYYRNYSSYHPGATGYLYRYNFYHSHFPQFFKDSNMYFRDRTMSAFMIDSAMNARPEWFDTMFNYKIPLEIYHSDTEDPSQLVATYSYENGFQKTDNYERYANKLGGLEPYFIETGLFNV